MLKRNLKLKFLLYIAIWILLNALNGNIAPITAKGIPNPSLPTNDANSSRQTMIAIHNTIASTIFEIKATLTLFCLASSLSNSYWTRNFWNPASANISANEITIIIVAKIPNAVGAKICANMIFVIGVISFAKISVISDHLAAATTLVSIDIQIHLITIYIL